MPNAEALIEPDLLYPLLRWADVDRWHATPSAWLLLAQDPIRRRGLDEAMMRAQYPRTYAYLERFRALLEDRAAYRRYQAGAAFYSMYNVAAYTLAPIKVVWRRMDRWIRAVVVQAQSIAGQGPRPVIPQETCVLVATESSDEAHYFCALANSGVVSFSCGRRAWRGARPLARRAFSISSPSAATTRPMPGTENWLPGAERPTPRQGWRPPRIAIAWISWRPSYGA